MKRRTFVKQISLTTASLPLISPLSESLAPPKHMEAFIRQNDIRVDDLLKRQERREGHPFRGGWANIHKIYLSGTPAALTSYLTAAYVAEGSRHYKSVAVKDCLELAADFFLKAQHEDGNIDLLTTNFHSPPDVAFAAEPLGLALTLLRRYMPKELSGFQEKAGIFLQKGGEAMRIGGIHTPNHRWVVCRALSRINSLFPNPGLIDRVEEWLAEKIDIDPDGQYTEKSVVVYSPITNDSLIAVARMLGKTELYTPVRKNLEMMQYFLHANGEVVTEASRRQDQFKVSKITRNYYAYRYMALLDENPRFAAMVEHIEQSDGLERLAPNLPYFLEDDRLKNKMRRPAKLPSNYVRHFPHSDLVRIRRGTIDATILAKNFICFTCFKGNAALQAVRLASAFFGKGQFTSPSLKIEEGKYILEQELFGPYYQPFPKDKLPDDGDWSKMPRHVRPQSEVQRLLTRVIISEIDKGFQIEFDIQGTDHVPFAIELAFRKGGTFTGVRKLEQAEDSYVLEDGMGTYTLDGDTLEFGPGKAEHEWTQLRGAKPKLNGDSVYLTGYTPFQGRIRMS